MVDTQQILDIINKDVREKISLSKLFSNSRVGIFVNIEIILQKEVDRLFGEGIFDVWQKDQYSFEIELTEKGRKHYEKICSEVQVSAPSDD